MTRPVSTRRRRRGAGAFSPGELFANGEQGAWYDPSDFATLYQDSAGTTPVTALGQPVGLMIDKANWDGRGVVNLLQQTEAFDQSPWAVNNGGVGINPVVTADAATAPDGSTTADKVDFDLNGGTTSSDFSVLSQQFEIPSTGNYTASIWIKAATAGDVGKEIAVRHVQRSPWGIFALTADWQRVDRTEPASVTTTRIIEIALRGTVTTDDTVSVLVWGAQMEAGSTATAYQPNLGAVVGGPGNHAAQATAAARPTVQARVNLLERTEELDDVYWFKSGGVVVTPNAIAAPDGTMTADLGNKSTTSSFRGIARLGGLPELTSSEATFSVYMKAGTSSVSAITLGDNTAGLNRITIVVAWNSGVPTISGGTGIIQDVGNGWYRIIGTSTAIVPGNTMQANMYPAGLGADVGTTYLWGAQLEQGSTATTYQRVTTATDYADIGLPRYLEFDGVDDAMATQSVDFSASDEMTAVMGVSEIYAQANPQGGIELSAIAPNIDGGFLLFVDGASAAGLQAFAGSRGSIFRGASFTYTISDFVLTGLSDISSPVVSLRQNGVVVDTNTDSQGVGSYRDAPLFIGARNQASFFLKGRIHQLIVRGATTSGALLDQTERFVARKTGVTL